MSQNSKVCVAILNYNGRYFLEKYLPSVLNNLPGFASVVIIDNCSTDDSISFLKSNFPEILIIQNPSNLGFAGGYNTGLKGIDSEYFILLNSDVEVSSGWIEPMIELMESESLIGAVQPKILWTGNKKSFEYAGAAGGVIDYLGYPFCRGRIFETLETDIGQYDKNCNIFWATGACMLIKKELFYQVGGFDERFFAHMEEIDLCWKLQKEGYNIAFCHNSKVFHEGAGTLKKSSPRKTFLNFRNNLLMLWKNHPGFGVIILPRLFLDGISGISYLLKLKPAHCLAIIKAHFWFYFNARKFKREPKALPPTVFRSSIVIQYFLKGRKKFTDLNWHPESLKVPGDRTVNQILQ